MNSKNKESLISLKNFPVICRICLSENNLSDFKDHNSLMVLFSKLTDIQIPPDGILPRSICSKCLQKLDEICSFLNLARNTDLTLRQFVLVSKIKVEPNFVDPSNLDSTEEIHFDPLLHSANNIEPINNVEEIKIHNDVYTEGCPEDVSMKKDPKTYSCPICFKTFVNGPNLCRHKKLHTGLKPFHCEVCEKSFAKKDNLKIHMKVHTGSKPFQCTICEKSFTQSGNLNVHLKSHLNLKPFSCTICLKAFSKKWILTDHLRRHSGERPFQCNLCEKNFAIKQSFRNHMRAHRIEDAQYMEEFGPIDNLRENPLQLEDNVAEQLECKLEDN